MIFHNPTKGTLLFDGVIDELCAYLRVDEKARYSLTIGSDSEQHGDAVEFISAIVIHRVGHGARYFWMRTEKPPFPNLRERIWHEAVLSTTLARSVLEALTARDAWWSDIEVHMDVGMNGPTKDLIREISGYVRAYGFVVCIKPEAYAASSVADRYI